MAELTEETVDSTSAEPSTGDGYLRSLIETAGDFGAPEPTAGQVTQPPPPEAAAATTTAATEEQPPPAPEAVETPDDPAKAAARDELIQQFAKETGLSPDDPNQRKTLKRLADKELFIRKLQADNETLKGTGVPRPGDAPEFITEFEKAEQPKPTEEPPAKPVATTAPPPANTEASKYGDIGDEWKTPEDSLTALNEAWSKNDLKGVHEVETARLRRNFDAVIAPPLFAFIDKMLEARFKAFAEKDLGDVLPQVRQTVAQQRLADDREFAVDQLRKAGMADIDALFAVEDGPPIKFDGQEFPNTPLNRLLVKHPEIMQISVPDADRSKAQRKTFIARYRLAYQLHRQAAPPPVSAEVAKELVKQGEVIANGKESERARQALNSGTGASGLGGEKAGTGGYVSELNNLPGEISFSSLLK